MGGNEGGGGGGERWNFFGSRSVVQKSPTDPGSDTSPGGTFTSMAFDFSVAHARYYGFILYLDNVNSVEVISLTSDTDLLSSIPRTTWAWVLDAVLVVTCLTTLWPSQWKLFHVWSQI